MADRDFKGVWIPKEVWLDERLTMLEKGILVEIDSLDRDEDGCWASNEHLANFCQCSVTKVATAVTKLVSLGYLRRESFDGRRRKLKSSLSFFKRQTFKDLKSDFKKVKESNTNKEYKKSITRKSAEGEIPDGFTDFWNCYPRKVSKTMALKAWKKLAPGADLLHSILADVNRRLEGEWKEKDMQYIPHPSTYLNQRRWEDETSTGKVEEQYTPSFKDLSREERERLEQKFADEYWAKKKQGIEI